MWLVAIWVSACGSVPPATAVATRQRDAVRAPAPFACPPIELRGDPNEREDDLRVASLLQRIFTANGGGEPLTQQLDLPAHSAVLARAAETHACPVWYDGEFMELSDPDLGVLPVFVLVPGNEEFPPRVSPEMDDAYRERLATREIRAWLDGHRGFRVSQGRDHSVLLHLVQRPADSLVCLTAEEGAEVAQVRGGRCFRVDPPVGTAAVLALARRGADRDAEGRLPVDRVFLSLDDTTYELVETGLEPGRLPAPIARFGFRLPGLHVLNMARATVPSRRGPRTIEPAVIGDVPLHALGEFRHGGPQPLGDSCSWSELMEDLLCCVQSDRWSCADVATARRLGGIDARTLVVEPGRLRFEADHSAGDRGIREANRILHFVRFDADALVEEGSLEIGARSEAYAAGEESELEPGVEAAASTLTWSYAVRGAHCVEYLSVLDEEWRVASLGPSGEWPTHPTRIRPIQYAPSPESLPRFAPRVTRFWVGSALGGGSALGERSAIVDRRGLWGLNGREWTRVGADRCGPSGG